MFHIGHHSPQNMVKKRALPILWVIVGVLLITLVSVWSVSKLKQDLYEERTYNSGRVMNKIATNIETVMEAQMNHVVFDARLVVDRNLSSDSEAAAYLKSLETMGSTKKRPDLLLLIDKDGNCLASDGRLFRWAETEILRAGEAQLLVSNINALGLHDEQMLFLVPLPKEVKTTDRTLTHMCMVMEQDVVGNYLLEAQYVEGSALFIIQDNGTYIYRYTENSSFSSIFNLISKLEQWEYGYKTSAEQTIHDLQNKEDGCAFVSVDGNDYFVVYNSLNINNWSAVYIVPESGASINSSDFMTSIILTVLLLAIIVMANVVGFLMSNHFRSMRQQTLINAQLQRAVDAEQSANNAKTRFLSSMSHDIRTPMNAIIGMTAIAEKHINDAKYVQDCLGKIHLASDHLLTLINDILDISKIESGKMTLNPTVFSLADSVNNMFNIIRPQANAKNQTLNIHVESAVHEYLMADELRLNQVFINILSNAIKYTPEDGQITATIREEFDKEAPDLVKLTYIVKDNGIGMTEEFMENMYGNFSRATDSRISKIQGTGLGLAICKQLVELMGGTIECESAVGKGTTFTISLELAAAAHPEENYLLSGMNLLLADDDEIFLESASELLREMDVALETAKNSEEAISMTKKQYEKGGQYSAILMDWKLAGHDGIETLKQIHSTINAEVPIILISAYDSTDIEQIALEAGAAGFMRKPFFKASLFQQMKQHLKIPKAGAQDADGETAGLEGIRILVAEDNDLNWVIARELMKMRGIHTERAENGKKCVERLQEAPDGEFDVVLMDIQMPVMDGREATRTIRAADREYLRTIPIIAMTADAFAEDISACLEAGMNSHVSKPINFETLLSELRKVTTAKKRGEK